MRQTISCGVSKWTGLLKPSIENVKKTYFGSMYSKVRAKVGQRSYIQGLHRLRNRRCHFQTFVVMYGSKNNVSMNATYSCS